MSEPFLAQVILIGANFAPRSWALCDGQILPINQNQSVYSLVGTTYGGDGRTSFALPDLRGRVPFGQGQGAGLPEIDLGEKSGSETNTLTAANLPPHSHPGSGTFHVSNAPPSTVNPAGKVFTREGRGPDQRYNSASDGATFNDNAVAVTVNNSGGGQSINNMQPFLALNYIFCMQGLFPSRN